MRYEQECLRDTMRGLASTTHGATVHGVWLTGNYPDTEIVVELSTRYRARQTLEWGLWTDDFGMVGPYGRVHPTVVGGDIMIQVYEF